jgi:putative NAD(P)-binding protein
MSLIVIFGAGGRIGSRVVVEAANGGHQVTAVTMDATSSDLHHGVTAASGDATSPSTVAALVQETDVVVSAVGAPDKSIYLRVARNLVETVAKAGASAPRIIHGGGGGSLLSADDVRFVDTPDFPAAIGDEVLARRLPSTTTAPRPVSRGSTSPRRRATSHQATDGTAIARAPNIPFSTHMETSGSPSKTSPLSSSTKSRRPDTSTPASLSATDCVVPTQRSVEASARDHSLHCAPRQPSASISSWHARSQRRHISAHTRQCSWREE